MEPDSTATQTYRYQRLEDFRLPAGFRGRPAWFVQLWWIVQATLFAMSPQFLYGWRRWLLRLFGAKIGAGVIIRSSVRITNPWKLTVGDYCQIGDYAELYTLGEIEIGTRSVVSQRSYICTGSHDHTSPTFDIYAKKIVIEPEVWIATDVFVAPGLRIGRGAVIGARSSVFKDVPPATISIGSPARVVGMRQMKDSSIG